MPWGMDENIIGIGNLPASLRSRIRNGIMVQRDGDGWTRFRPMLVVAAADGEACITDTDCVDHWIGDGSTFLDPDTPLPEATDRAPRPGDLIRLHKTLDPILVDIARYEGGGGRGRFARTRGRMADRQRTLLRLRMDARRGHRGIRHRVTHTTAYAKRNGQTILMVRGWYAGADG